MQTVGKRFKKVINASSITHTYTGLQFYLALNV